MSCEELTHWKRPWCWERLRAGGEGDDREWDGWMASSSQGTWVWVDSGSWWWTGRPSVLQFMGSQRVRHDWTIELNWTRLVIAFLPRSKCLLFYFFFIIFFLLIFFLFFNFAILYWFCHISKWIRHRYTCVPLPEPSSLFLPHAIPLGRPSAPAPSIQYRALNLDWRLVSYMILYMSQCHSPKSSHPLPLPQSPKDCSIHQCLFCCLIHRVIATIFLNSIYMH